MNKRNVIHEDLYYGRSAEVQKFLDFFLDYFGDEEMKCAKTEVLMRFLNEEFGETMSWVGKDENNASYVALYKNKDTGTWSLIQYGAAIGCFISSGSQGSPV